MYDKGGDDYDNNCGASDDDEEEEPGYVYETNAYLNDN